MQLFAEMKESVETKLGFIAQRAQREREGKFDNLMQLISKEYLKANYYQLGRDRAEGVDGISWKEYGERLEENLEELIGRMKRMGYRPQAARRVYIPKGEGQMRPLGIPTVEDKIVQRAMSRVMEAIYEQDFHEDSYGFRPKKGCHQALKKVNDMIKKEPINHVIEADIKGFFDNVGHEKMMELIKIRINDERFLRYIVRFLKAGYMDNGLLKETERGTPQGGNLSPMLANLFLHYVLDEWFEKEVRPQARGKAYLIRYCDDFVVLVQYQEDAKEIMKKLQERLKDNGLEMNDQKTRVISFGKYERENAQRQGRRTNTFDFLGFTHYCGISREGKFKVGRKTSSKRLRKRVKEMNEWLKAKRNVYAIEGLWKRLGQKLQGHYQYYGVSENSVGIGRYYWEVVKLIYKWINRRSQRRSFNWKGFNEYLMKFPLPKPRIVHRFYIPSKLSEAY